MWRTAQSITCAGAGRSGRHAPRTAPRQRGLTLQAGSRQAQPSREAAALRLVLAHGEQYAPRDDIPTSCWVRMCAWLCGVAYAAQSGLPEPHAQLHTRTPVRLAGLWHACGWCLRGDEECLGCGVLSSKCLMGQN